WCPLRAAHGEADRQRRRAVVRVPLRRPPRLRAAARAAGRGRRVDQPAYGTTVTVRARLVFSWVWQYQVPLELTVTVYVVPGPPPMTVSCGMPPLPWMTWVSESALTKSITVPARTVRLCGPRPGCGMVTPAPAGMVMVMCLITSM